MKNGFGRLIGAISVALCTLSFTAAAQTWSAAEQEVWKAVSYAWEVDSAGNTDAFMGCFHGDYRGWPWGSRVPNSKKTVSKFIGWRHKNFRVNVYNLTPLSIIVKGDMAVVHYLYGRSTTRLEGDAKAEWSEGRWTDILVKENGKWLLVADAGGRTNEDDDDD